MEIEDIQLVLAWVGCKRSRRPAATSIPFFAPNKKTLLRTIANKVLPKLIRWNQVFQEEHVSRHMQVLLISGSLRAKSTNTAVLRTAQRVAPFEVETLLFERIGEIPHYSADLDVDPLPAAVRDLRALLESADAILFCTPEYAGDLPGSFKNALDWMVGCPAMNKKPVAWINAASLASPTGAADAHASLRRVLKYLDARVVDEACIRIPLSHSDVSPHGTIDDIGIKAEISKALVALMNDGRTRAVSN